MRREELAISEPIISLDDPAARDAARVGEKAAALARMRQAGLPVPAGFVIEAAVFDEATAALAPRIESHLAAASDGMHALAEASRAIHELLAGLRLPRGLSEAVTAAYEALVDGAAVAVRSSGTAEELPGASFAGQYSSYLNVTGAEFIVERMLDVWASLYSPQAIAYRDRQGVAHSAARMAVLVQRQLAAEAAGVLFTRDPMSGAPDRLLINATLGLGEGVVSGETPVDSFSLDAESLAVVERAVADKTTMVAMRPGGGIEQQPVPESRRREPSLRDDRLADLGRLARSVQEIEGGHRDIEFAVLDGSVHLLQARPVTGLEASVEAAEAGDVDSFPVEWEDPEDERYAWTLAAGFTDPTPLHGFEKDVRSASAVHQRRAFSDTGVPMARNHILRFINGYPYVRGPDVSEGEVTERQRAHGALGQRYAERGENFYVGEIEPQTRAALDRLGSFSRPASESLASRLEHLERALEAYGHVMGDLHWRMAGAGGAQTSARWPATFNELTGEPEMDSGVLLQAIANKITRMTGRLRGLARLVQADGALRELFAAREFGRLEQPPFNRRPAVRRLRVRFRALLRDYGRRSGRSYGSSTSFATPTWNLDHRVPLDAVATYAEQDLDELDRLEQEPRRERQQASAPRKRRTRPRPRPPRPLRPRAAAGAGPRPEHGEPQPSDGAGRRRCDARADLVDGRRAGAPQPLRSSRRRDAPLAGRAAGGGARRGGQRPPLAGA